MFELFYKAGKSFADSFFIGREGKDVTVISASEVLPLDMQKKIVTAEAELDKPAEEVKQEVVVEGTEPVSGESTEVTVEGTPVTPEVKEEIKEEVEGEVEGEGTPLEKIEESVK